MPPNSCFGIAVPVPFLPRYTGWSLDLPTGAPQLGADTRGAGEKKNTSAGAGAGAGGVGGHNSMYLDMGLETLDLFLFANLNHEN